MTSAQVVETSVNVTLNSPSQDYTHPDDRTPLSYDMTPGFKPFTIILPFTVLFVSSLGMLLDINECSPDPCQNGATCNDLVGSYQCDCVPGYTGNNCQTGETSLICSC